MVWLAFGTTGLIVMGLALLLIARRPATEPTASGPSNTQKALLTQAGSRSMPPVAARRPTPAGDNQAPSDATKTVPSAEPSPEQPVAPVAARRPTPAGDNQAPSNVTIENGPNGLILKPLDARVRMNDDGTMNVTLVSARSSGDGLDFGLEHLSGMKNIRSLGFGLPLGVDEALRTLPNISLPGLERLCLGSTMVSDNGVANLKGMSGLKEINLERTAITDAGLAHLAGLTNLESLNLERTRVTDAGLKSLQGMINLRELVLDGTRITNPGLENLAGLTKMEELSIEFNDKLTGGLKNLSGMAHLKKLIIGHTNIGDDELAHLSGMRNLEEIYLDSTPIGDAGLDHLRHIISLKGVFTSFSKVTPEGKARLKKSLPGARIEGY